jgi:hypothetical protein
MAIETTAATKIAVDATSAGCPILCVLCKGWDSTKVNSLGFLISSGTRESQNLPCREERDKDGASGRVDGLASS